MTKNGTQDTLGTQKWSLFDPKTVNFGYERPIMVSKMTKNGTQDTLGTQKWSLFDPKTVNFGYERPIMVSKMTKNGTQLVQKTHKLWSKQCKFCKNYTNYGQNSNHFAPKTI